jgi:CheY-like chemotaxis protein
MARAKDIGLKFVRSSLTVRSDRRMLRRIVQNLVSNAVKYTPSGRVLVGCRRIGNQVRIDVYDTGVGIPAAHRRDIFAEFRRLDRGARIARGLGLGLSIVERCARVLGHKVEVDSLEGHCSRFSITLPRASDIPFSPQLAPLVVDDPGQLAGTVALCIDNEPSILDGMETLLRGWNCKVLKAPDLQTAVAVLADCARMPNGLLVDYHLDEGNGIDAIRSLRERFGATLPAILITADRTLHVRDEARAANIQLLHKPVKPAALRALLAQWRVLRVAAAE